MAPGLAGVGSATLALDESKVTPGIVGFLVVFALGIATWLLIRSMTTQLKKVDFEEKDTKPSAPDEATGDETDQPHPTA
jgi:hypothetical protein